MDTLYNFRNSTHEYYKSYTFLQANSALPPSNGTHDIDAIMVTEGTTPHNYADGNSPSWIWNGATNASTSTGPAQ